MGSAIHTASSSLKTVEWMWQSNPDPWSESETPTWGHYSDLENLIIEDAFSSKQPKAMLDDYYIDLTSNMQISNTDSHKQRPVKRVVRKREDKHLREARFMDLPVASNRSFGEQYGFVSPFIIEVRRHLRLELNELPSKKPQLIPILIDKAAHGFIVEGRNIGKQVEAKKLASLLLECRERPMTEVWKCCAYLYSLESFLYTTLNTTMRLVGSDGDDQTWRSKVPTLGPFSLLLWDNPFNTRTQTGIELYRAANLTPEQITQYEAIAKKQDEYGSFQGFSSCSRNRTKAEGFGNALFVMKVVMAFIADLSKVSEYPDEEELLVTPGVCFRVLSVDFDDKKEKHIIHLELRQRWSSK